MSFLGPLIVIGLPLLLFLGVFAMLTRGQLRSVASPAEPEAYKAYIQQPSAPMSLREMRNRALILLGVTAVAGLAGYGMLRAPKHVLWSIHLGSLILSGNLLQTLAIAFTVLGLGYGVRQRAKWQSLLWVFAQGAWLFWMGGRF